MTPPRLWQSCGCKFSIRYIAPWLNWTHELRRRCWLIGWCCTWAWQSLMPMSFPPFSIRGNIVKKTSYLPLLPYRYFWNDCAFRQRPKTKARIFLFNCSRQFYRFQPTIQNICHTWCDTSKNWEPLKYLDARPSQTWARAHNNVVHLTIASPCRRRWRQLLITNKLQIKQSE